MLLMLIPISILYILSRESVIVVLEAHMKCKIYLANSAEDESDLIQNIQFNSNLCIINMHSLFGITFILNLLKLSAGKGFCT